MKRFLIIFLTFLSAYAASAEIVRLNQPVIVKRAHELQPIIIDATSIDSITFSRFTPDSVLCPTIQTQLVWTADTVFRIPLDDIDEVAFTVSPNTPNADVTVVEINDKIMESIIGVVTPYSETYSEYEDEFYISFDKEKSCERIPDVGEIWVLDGINSVFPNGFIGRCTRIDMGRYDTVPITAYFEPADWSEAYSNYFSAYRYTPEQDLLNDEVKTDLTLTQASQLKRKAEYWLPWFRLPLELGAEKEWKDNPISMGLSTEFEVATRIGIKYDISRYVSNNTTLTTIGIHGSQQFEFSGGLSLDGSVSNSIPLMPDIQRPIPAAPAFMLGLSADLKIELSGKLGWIFLDKWQRTVNYGLRIVHSSDDDQSLSVSPSLITEASLNPNTISYGEGSFKVGAEFRPNLALLNRHLVSVGPYYSINIGSEIMMPTSQQDWAAINRTSQIYSEMSADDAFNISIINLLGGSFTMANRVFKIEGEVSRIPLNRRPIIPAVESMSAQRRSATEVVAVGKLKDYSLLSGPVLHNFDRGFVAYETEKGNVVGEEPVASRWISENDVDNGEEFKASFNELSPDKSYRVFPAYRPFQPLGSDLVMACEPYSDIRPIEKYESDGVFKTSYVVQPKDSSKYYGSCHYIFEIEYPDFDFNQYVDADTEEWGWFCFDDEEYCVPSDIDPELAPYYCAAYKFDRFYNGYFDADYSAFAIRPLNGKLIGGTKRECIIVGEPDAKEEEYIEGDNNRGPSKIKYSLRTVIGYYAKQKTSDMYACPYKVLFAKHCELSYIDYPSVYFSNLSSYWNKTDDDHYVLHFSFNYNRNEKFMPYRSPQLEAHFFNEKKEQYYGYPLMSLKLTTPSGDEVQEWFIAEPGKSIELTCKDSFNKLNQYSNKLWDAYRIKDTIQLHGKIGRTYNGSSSERYIIIPSRYDNHVFIEMDIDAYPYPVTGTYVKRFSHRIRSNGWPIKYVETINHSSKYRYAF